jgi:hypothetical protein
VSRNSWHILFLSILTVIDETAFLYIACMEWSRDESSETFSRVQCQYRWSARALAISSCAAGSQVCAARLSRGALLPRSWFSEPQERGLGNASLCRVRSGLLRCGKQNGPLSTSGGLLMSSALNQRGISTPVGGERERGTAPAFQELVRELLES